MSARCHGQRAITNALQKRFHYSEAEAYNLVRVIFGAIKRALASGKQVKLPFGTLYVKKTKQQRFMRLGYIVTVPRHKKTVLMKKKLYYLTNQVVAVEDLHTIPWR